MALPLFPPERDPGPDFVGLLRLTADRADAHRAASPRRRRASTSRCPTARRWWRCATPTASSWPATAGPRRATSSPTTPWRRSSRPTATPPSPSPGRPAWPSRWSGSSRCSSSTTRRSRARRSRSRARPTSWPRWCASTCPLAMQGLAVVPLFAGYDTARGHGPHLQLRRHRRPLRGHRLPGHRLGRARRPQHGQAGLARGPDPRRGGRPGHPVALRRGRRGLGHGRSRPRARHLPDHRPRRRRRATARCPRTRWPSASAR